jgi:cyclopropane fatty-acyl-phospholipid synthase-like methyltransferase
MGFNPHTFYIYITIKTNDMKTQKDLIAEFLFEIQIINPIEIIIQELQDKKFTDSDIDWLNSKFESFINLAAKTLDIKIDQDIPKGDMYPVRMNDHAYDYYEKHFKLLLNHFKTYDK